VQPAARHVLHDAVVAAPVPPARDRLLARLGHVGPGPPPVFVDVLLLPGPGGHLRRRRHRPRPRGRSLPASFVCLLRFSVRRRSRAPSSRRSTRIRQSKVCRSSFWRTRRTRRRRTRRSSRRTRRKPRVSRGP
jgi:hypothetical protein